jgi:phosphate transport system substrate-binding protein
MTYLIKKYCFLLPGLVWISCNTFHEQRTDTPTSGTISLTTDESFLPIIDAEVMAFEYLYPDSKIQIQYKSEDEAVMALLNNKTEMIVISRELNKREKEFIKSKNISVLSNKMATDAIAIIVNSEYPERLMTIGQLKQIISGNIKRWNELAPNLPKEEIEIIIDKSNSGNLSFLKQKMNLNSGASKIYAAGSNKEVMEYVKKNKTGLGIIGVNWISDDEDPDLDKKLNRIKVLAIAEGNEKDSSKFYQPLQDNLGEGRYSLTRPLYLINKNTKTGLGAGFSSFLLSDHGQRIVLKNGLLPATMPGREIEIKRN